MSEGIICPQCRGYAEAHNQRAWDECFLLARAEQREADAQFLEAHAAQMMAGMGTPHRERPAQALREAAAAIRAQGETR